MDDSGNSKTSKNSSFNYIIVGIFAILLIGAIIFFMRDSPNGGERVSIEVGDSPSIGSIDAKVTIIEFSDFSCPFCAAAAGGGEDVASSLRASNSGWEPSVPGIMKDYVDSGKVRFVFKYYPGHGNGQNAHLVSLCLNEQGLFWKFHEEAFVDYESTNDLAKMKALAVGVGADLDLLEKCLSENQEKYTKQLSDEVAQARTAGVKGTPSFYINGLKVEGAVPYSDIKEVIDSELNK